MPDGDPAWDPAQPWDFNGHGTMVAGVAAAATNNAVGIAGAGWDLGIMPVKVLNKDGLGSDADIASGIAWAADNGADVINLSLGGYATSAVLREAVSYAVSRGVVITAAAGNGAASRPVYPASYPQVVAVAATDREGAYHWFNSHGWWVDLAAPGGVLFTTIGDFGEGRYASGTGTSFAAAVVSGVTGLLRHHEPALGRAQVAARLWSTAWDLGPRGFDPYFGSGLVDAYAALGGEKRAPQVPPADASEPNGTPDQARHWRTYLVSVMSVRDATGVKMNPSFRFRFITAG